MNERFSLGLMLLIAGLLCGVLDSTTGHHFALFLTVLLAVIPGGVLMYAGRHAEPPSYGEDQKVLAALILTLMLQVLAFLPTLIRSVE